MENGIINGCLAAILLYASIADIRTRRVPNVVHLLILFLALIRLAGYLCSHNWIAVVNKAAGFLIAIAVMLLAQKCCSGLLGGADIKLMAVCGLLLGFVKTVAALFLGSAAALLITVIIRKARKEDFHRGFPFIPYLSAGILAAQFLQFRLF